MFEPFNFFLGVFIPNTSYINLEKQFGTNNYKPLDVVLCRGEGVWVWDVDDKRYLDCLSAYSAVNQGHCHPIIMAALIDQARKLTLTSRAFRNDQLGLLYKDIRELIHYHKILPMNSGAEAVETAIKTVRKWGYEIKGVPQNKETHDHIIRFAPPLVIKKDEIDWALDKIAEVFH